MLNTHIAAGFLIADPEYSVTAEGTSVSRFCIASQDDIKKADGTYDTDFINCVAFNKSAEFAHKFLRKGKLVTVVGRQKPRSYEDKDGVRHKTTRLVVNKIYFGEGKRDDPAAASENADKPSEPSWNIPDEELPF